MPGMTNLNNKFFKAQTCCRPDGSVNMKKQLYLPGHCCPRPLFYSFENTL